MKDDFFNYLVATNSIDSFLGRKIKLTNKQILLLDEYNINYNVDSIDKLLINIEKRINSFIGTKDYNILNDLYNGIYKLNK